MRDGKELYADLYLPPKKGKYPTVLIQTPYNKDNQGTPIGTGKPADGGKVKGHESDTLGLLDRKNYAYVVVDWRGFYKNKKAMTGVNKRKWKRGHDGYDTVEWIAGQDWSDGKVGTWGGSALGKVQFETILEKPPHLVCASPNIAVMGTTYKQYFKNGVPMDAHLKTLDFLGFGLRKIVRENPEPDSRLWKFVESKGNRPQDIHIPCLVITGWWDNYPSLIMKDFDRYTGDARKHSKLLIGPWDHMTIGLTKSGDLEFKDAYRASADAAKAFFDYHLRGINNDWQKTPRVRYWECGPNKWRGCEDWNKLERKRTTFYAHSDGQINATKPNKPDDDDLTRVLKSNPKSPTPTLGGANLKPLPAGPVKHDKILKRDDVLVYRTGKLEKPLKINGRVELEWTFWCNRVDCDFCPRLCEVTKKGECICISDTAIRARLRNDKSEPLKLGQGYTIGVKFTDISYVIPEGSELMLIMAETNSPRYERNPHNGDPLWSMVEAKDVEITIRHEEAHAFKIIVPSLKK